MRRFVLALTFAAGALAGHAGLLLGAAQEKLTLTTPVSSVSTTDWHVADIYLSTEAPAVKVTLVSNVGERFIYRYVPSDTVTAAQVRTALSYINQGKFMTLQGKTLERWLLEKISADGVKVGTVSGTPQ